MKRVNGWLVAVCVLLGANLVAQQGPLQLDRPGKDKAEQHRKPKEVIASAKRNMAELERDVEKLSELVAGAKYLLDLEGEEIHQRKTLSVINSLKQAHSFRYPGWGVDIKLEIGEPYRLQPKD